jgi:hypothetical protein
MDQDPEVGAVYEDPDGKTFEVRAFDENEGTVEVEYADGSTETMDLDAWYELDLTQIESADEDDEDEESAKDAVEGDDYPEDDDYDDEEEDER